MKIKMLLAHNKLGKLVSLLKAATNLRAKKMVHWPHKHEGFLQNGWNASVILL